MKLIESINNKRPKNKINIEIYEGAGHGLFVKDTYRIREEYLEFLTAWILSVS